MGNEEINETLEHVLGSEPARHHDGQAAARETVERPACGGRSPTDQTAAGGRQNTANRPMMRFACLAAYSPTTAVTLIQDSQAGKRQSEDSGTR